MKDIVNSISITCLIHILFLIFFSIDHTQSLEKKSEKIIITTKRIEDIKSIKQQTNTKQKSTIKNVKISKTKRIKQKPLPSKQILKKIDKNLAQIKSNNKTERNTKPNTPTVANDELSTPTFYDQICDIFINNLTLPDKGKVKLTISLQSNGKINKIVLINTESLKNWQYLNDTIPTLTLPQTDNDKNIDLTINFYD